MSRSWPGVSVIVPTFNAAAHLPRLFDSLKQQDYPWNQLDLIVVDDDSEDNTLEVAKKYGARVFRNGHRHIERGKSIGLAQAKETFVLFLDADNYLPESNWITSALAPLVQDPGLVGAESIRFYYNRQDPAANRYCSLFGINDPLAFYLNRRDRLAIWEKDWRLMGRIEDQGGYYVGTFQLPEVPTLGSQGFLIRRDFLLQVEHEPYLFHMEANLELIRQGHNRYVLLKSSVGHDHVTTAAAFVKKCRRNILLFYRWQQVRTYTWDTPPLKLFWTVLGMVTLVRPTWDAVRAYGKTRDGASFLHVWFSLVIPVLYAWETVAHKVKSGAGLTASNKK